MLLALLADGVRRHDGARPHLDALHGFVCITEILGVLIVALVITIETGTLISHLTYKIIKDYKMNKIILF